MSADHEPDPIVKVVIRDGLVTGLTPPHPTAWRYWIDVVEDGGGEYIVWDGTNYIDALAAADEWRRDGIHVDDQVRRPKSPFVAHDGGRA